MAMGGLIVVALLTTTQGFAQHYSGYVDLGQTVYVTEVTQVLPPPKYALWEGVDAAVKALLQRGVPITFDNVNEELYVMHKNNDIHLPYEPYWHGHMKRPLTKKKREKAMFENELRKRIETISRSYAEKGINVGDPTPQPSQFSSKERFVSAYATAVEMVPFLINFEPAAFWIPATGFKPPSCGILFPAASPLSFVPSCAI